MSLLINCQCELAGRVSVRVWGAPADLELDSQAGVGGCRSERQAGHGCRKSTDHEGGCGQVLGVSGLQSAYQEGRTQAVLLKPLIAAELLQYNSKNPAPKNLSPWLWSPSSAGVQFESSEGRGRAELRSSGPPMPASASMCLGWLVLSDGGLRDCIPCGYIPDPSCSLLYLQCLGQGPAQQVPNTCLLYE